MKTDIANNADPKAAGFTHPAVSVVVPFFNVLPYVSDCLDSLVNQDFDSYEVVCVDDGSTDGTAAALDEYAARFPHVRAYHFQNEGLSVARNRGVQLAQADLISFVDGDDCVSPRYLSTLFSAHGGVPGRMAQGKYVDVRRGPDGRRAVWPEKGDANGVTSLRGPELRRELFLGKLPVTAWARLAHRSLYEEVPFAPGMVYEDVMAAPDVADHIVELVLIDDVIYAHNRRNGSLSRPSAMTVKTIVDSFAAQLHFVEVAQGWEEEVRRLIPWKMSLAYATVIALAMELPDRREAEPYVRDAVGYVRGHYAQFLKLSLRHSLGLKPVLRCALAAISPRLYAAVRKMRHRLQER